MRKARNCARPAGIVGIDHYHRVAIDQVLLEIRPDLLGAGAQRLREYRPAAYRGADLGGDLAMPQLRVEDDNGRSPVTRVSVGGGGGASAAATALLKVSSEVACTVSSCNSSRCRGRSIR